MNKTAIGMATAACMLLAGAAANLAFGEEKVIDSTNTTFGWQVLNDKPPAPTLEVVSGPKSKSKALQLNYQFADGIWIAIVKNVNLAIGAQEGIKFIYQGSGATVNVKVKISDAAGTVFGYTVPYGSVSSVWKEVVIPRGAFGYLWGGSGEKGMNWSNIAKLEITLDTDSITGMSYSVDTSKPGKLTIYNLELVNTKGMKVTAPLAAAPVQSTFKAIKDKYGFYMIHKMYSPDGWTTMADQDGKVDLSSKVVIVGKNTTKALKVDYAFGGKGIWDAVILPISLDLSQMKYMRFMFKGEGGANNLVLKVADANGTVFGYTIPHPTNQKTWKGVIVAKDQMHYLYGGSGAGGMDWAHIQKIEYTLEKKDDKMADGSIYLRRLQFK